MSKPETTTLVYQGPEPVVVPDAGLVAEPGKPVPIPSELAASLLARPEWAKAEKKAPAKERES